MIYILFSQDTVIGRLEHMSDIVIKLESFAGSAKETNPLFKEYHGLLHMRKLPALSTLAPHCPIHRDLVFKLRRKKFLIEVSRFHSTIKFHKVDVNCYIVNYC